MRYGLAPSSDAWPGCCRSSLAAAAPRPPPGRSPVRNRIWIEAQFPYLSSRLAVVDGVDSIRQQEFCPALRSVSLYGNDHSGTNENAVNCLLGNHDTAFFNAETFTQIGRYYNRPSPSDFCRLHSFWSHICQIIQYVRHSDKPTYRGPEVVRRLPQQNCLSCQRVVDGLIRRLLLIVVVPEQRPPLSLIEVRNP